jgi:hypothetical protein
MHSAKSIPVDDPRNLFTITMDRVWEGSANRLIYESVNHMAFSRVQHKERDLVCAICRTTKALANARQLTT